MSYLIVAIHDAAPPYLETLREITTWLDQNAIRPRCIKVIPDYLHCWNILDHRDFLDWMLEEKEKGHEIIQHGYSHQAPEKLSGAVIRLQDRFITNGEAEFLTRDYRKLKMTLEEGRRIMEKAGVSCSGFTAPTWYQSREAIHAIQDCGFRYFTTLSAIYDCQRKRRFFSLAMGFQGVNGSLEYLNMWGNILMRRTGLLCSPLARIVLHPRNGCKSRPFVQALEGILQLSRKRELVTYRQFLELE
ncbi:MAG: DUF2334 domain-containing protein [Candidatus Aminicenantales bacterium]